MKERVNYFAIPIELVACPFFSLKEKFIITTILRLSDKFLTKGGCNLTNKQLAFQHRVSSQSVSNAISKADRLGFVINREDIIHKEESEIKRNEYSTERRIQMRIPEEWELMGDLYNHAFIYQDEVMKELFMRIEKELKYREVSEIDQEEVGRIINEEIDISPPIKNFIAPPIPKVITYYKGIKDYKSIKKPSRKRTKNSIPMSYEKIRSSWNNIAKESSIPSVKKLSPERKQQIRVRNKSLSLTRSDWIEVFKEIENSSFLKYGDNNRDWTITFDWLVHSDENFAKVLEGNYSDKKRKLDPDKGSKSGYIPGKYANIKTRKMINGEFIEE